MPQTQKKRIFLNLDGTGQSESNLKGKEIKIGSMKTLTSSPVSNIARIGRATVCDDHATEFQQIVYYLAGVGASSEDSVIAQGYQSFTGTGLLQNVREAYGFLCNNYDYDDEIYITGFSRGAFTARSVAGLVGKVGILTKKGLDLFYEAFDYYENNEKWRTHGNPCPVSEAAETTRFRNPDTKEEIKIKAVGVFDTVGALSGDSAFHDVKYGDHIENAFHALALDEKRGYFFPTLWESAKHRDLKHFEQCWMVGDHSNVGGSWDDQQLADISLVWMMSKYASLGAKFNVNYVYDEFVKYQKFVEKEANKSNKEPKVRRWGEGKLKEVTQYKTEKFKSGTATRAPKMYREKIAPTNWWFETLPDLQSKLLTNTNETIHPSVRYRHFCQKGENLGVDDKGPYTPKALDGWEWPSKDSEGVQVYIKKAGNKTETDGDVIPESTLGYYEQILLALYDDGKETDGVKSVWDQVVGAKPSKDVLDVVREMAKGKK